MRKLLLVRLRLLHRLVALASVSALYACATSPSFPQRSISIERTACYGPCPVYRFTLYSDGRYVWEGRAHVAILGTVRGSMGARTYATAMQLLGDARYLEFKDSYGSDSECQVWATDSATIEIVVKDASGPKTISHYGGCQGFARQEVLTQLEDNMDKVLRTREFIR
jgi:hypothetical protein